MTIRVAWSASSDPAIASYKVQSSPDNSTWSDLATVAHAIPGPNWDSTRSVFYYDDAAGVAATWYRLAAVDTLSQQSVWSPSFQATNWYVPPWETVQQIVTSAAWEVGLGSAGSDVMSSTDPNIQQLCYLLRSGGRELVHMRPWTHLRKEYTFVTVAGVGTYALPPDFHNMIDQSGWNRTNRLPVGGPLSAQEWQFLKARLVGIVWNVLFRPMDRQLYLYPDTNTPGGYTIAYEYHSSYWISTSGTPDTATADAPSASTDYVWFDPLLMVRKLKLDFLKAKGFDTTSAQQDYNTTLEAVKGHDSPQPKLSLTRGSLVGYDPLIGQQSIPVTGFGA